MSDQCVRGTHLSYGGDIGYVRGVRYIFPAPSRALLHKMYKGQAAAPLSKGRKYAAVSHFPPLGHPPWRSNTPYLQRLTQDAFTSPVPSLDAQGLDTSGSSQPPAAAPAGKADHQ